MIQKTLEYISENKISPFSQKTFNAPDCAYCTKDAKGVYSRVITKLSSGFIFKDTKHIFSLFYNTPLKEKQDFFRDIRKTESSFLKKVTLPKPAWKPSYSVICATENEKAFMQLRSLGIPATQVTSQYDIAGLNDYELIYIIDADEFERALEELPQTVFVNSIDELYLERYLVMLSGWKPNLELIRENIGLFGMLGMTDELNSMLDSIWPLFELMETEKVKLSPEETENKLQAINATVHAGLKELTVTGDMLYEMLSRGRLTPEVDRIISKAVEDSKLSSRIFIRQIPVAIDYEQLNTLIKEQDSLANSSFAQRLKRHSATLREIPKKLEKISDILVLFDFAAGLSDIQYDSFPIKSEDLSIEKSKNLFLDKAQPVTFYLNDKERCSILTGANSGGKTTLLEHIIQLHALLILGLPVTGSVRMPDFSEIYYFAKSKGSMNKGAFETLLTQMSKIKPGKRTLILADEIEAVTEPGVAGNIISATAEYFAEKGCYLVIATHLGQEINKALPMYARIDGIEAKGLDENFNLIIDHSPVLGRLANSTPELIVERMANTSKNPYFSYIHRYVKDKK